MPIGSIYFEHTPARSVFRALAGNSNRCLNTVLVGLETLKAHPPIKPKDLSVGWSKPTIQNEWDEARLFSLRGAMVAVVDGLDQYMRTISRIDGLVDLSLDPYLNARKMLPDDKKPSMAQRLAAIDKVYPGVMGDEHIAVVGLLAAWRNKLVHDNTQRVLSLANRRFLLKSAKYLHDNNSGVDIRATVSRFEKDEAPALSDVWCMVACSQRIVTNLDERLLFNQSGKNYAIALLKYLMQEEGPPSDVLEEIFRYGGKQSAGKIYSRFLHNGGNSHGVNRNESAPTLTGPEFKALFGIGRKAASNLLGIPRP